jgi:hypothetical protein
MRDDAVSEEMRLLRCINEEAAVFVHRGFPMQDSRTFWDGVFWRHYGALPVDDNDPRWNKVMFELKGRQKVRLQTGHLTARDVRMVAGHILALLLILGAAA